MTTLPINVLIWFPNNSDRESDSVRSVPLHLANSDTGLDMEQYLNI